MTISGIHHVTAIAGGAQRNLDFYTQVLGLRLVKKTVNFDDPGTYHLYFGDRVGSPGTIMTFFPWANAAAGRIGAGLVSTTSFSIPKASTGFWIERLVALGVQHDVADADSGPTTISLYDPDGLKLALVAHVDHLDEAPVWGGGDVAAEHAIRSFYGVTLRVADPEKSARLLTDVFGFIQQKDGSMQLVAPGNAAGRVIAIERDGTRGRGGRGTVHHVAFRAASDDEQAAWRERLHEAGYNVTPVLDRQYFRSVYFREPGGVLYEIATDGPGFGRDETVETLGSELKLPEWLESRRTGIEASLPPLRERAHVE